MIVFKLSLWLFVIGVASVVFYLAYLMSTNPNFFL